MAVNLPMQASAAPPSQSAASEPDREVLSRLEVGRIAARGPDGAVRVRRAERGACFLYGPYWELPAGGYRLSFSGRFGDNPRFRAMPVIGVEIIVLDRLQHAWRDFTAGELAGGAGEILFDVPPEISLEAGNEGRFEFRFFHFGNADLEIEAVRLSRLGLEPVAAGAERRWRMLGRLEVLLGARRDAEGAVGAGQRGRPGLLLRGGWPYLRLPCGHYLLSVGAQARSPRADAGPVLAAEIVANSHWRGGPGAAASPSLLLRREFAAEELARGGGAVEFAVPAELSLEAGANAPFELRLFQLGNTPLTIETVDVTRLVRPAMAMVAASAPVPAVHPLGRRNVIVVGNCQAEIVWQAFARTESLSAQFAAKYHFVRLPANLHEFAKNDLARCDILLVQDLRDWEQFPLRDCVPARLQPVKFPGLRFASLWPFDGWNGPTDTEANRREGPNTRFPYLDGLLARLRAEIPDREQRFRVYRSLEWPGIINYRRRHDLERRELEAMDRKFAIEIGAAMLDRFRTRRIFHTTVHPSREIFEMLMRFVLKSIEARGRYRLPEQFETLLHDPQVPVHPKVARDLGAVWADDNTLYRSRGASVTWEQYVRSYIEHYG